MTERPVRRPFRGALSTQDTEEKRIQRRKMWAVIAICAAAAAAVALDFYLRFHPPAAPPVTVPVESASPPNGS